MLEESPRNTQSHSPPPSPGITQQNNIVGESDEDSYEWHVKRKKSLPDSTTISDDENEQQIGIAPVLSDISNESSDTKEENDEGEDETEASEDDNSPAEKASSLESPPQPSSNSDVSEEDDAKDESLAESSKRKAAWYGDSEAKLQMGFSYYNGNADLDISENTKKAVIWFRKSAKHKNAAAQNMIGICYEYGIGIEKNCEKAFKWYTEAAKKKHPHAFYNLAHCYENGIGTSPNRKQAAHYRKLGKKTELSESKWEISRADAEIKHGTQYFSECEQSDSCSSTLSTDEEASDNSPLQNEGKIESSNDDASEDTDSLESPPKRQKLLSTPSTPQKHNIFRLSKDSSSEKLHKNKLSTCDHTTTKRKDALAYQKLRKMRTSHHSGMPDDLPIISSNTASDNSDLKIDPSEISYSPTKFFTAPHRQTKIPLPFTGKRRSSTSNSRFFENHIDREARSERERAEDAQVGLWGEEVVFLLLQKHYLREYAGARFEDKGNGLFVLKSQNSEGEKIKVELTWYNKDGETGEPIDLKLTETKNGQEEKVRYIEVKTTRSLEKDMRVAHFSEEEVELMRAHGPEYALYRVYGANRLDARVEITEDPWDKLKNGMLSVSHMGIRI